MGRGKCKYCGASRERLFERGEGLETHAYAFIHTDDIKTRVAELFGGNMQFDVIIGNPPYQLAATAGTRDVPIYHLFVRTGEDSFSRAFSAMVIPSRWMACGLGLSEFRQRMLGDRRMREPRGLSQRPRTFSWCRGQRWGLLLPLGCIT